MYQQLRQDLLARIRGGEFGPGDLLPSENQLCEEYGVSITTARRAFLELVKEGVVQRKAGVGTTVAPRVRQARLAFVSVDEEGDAWRHVSSAMGELISGIGEHVWRRNASFSTSRVEGEGAAVYLRNLAGERSVDGVLLRVANDVDEEYLDVLEGASMPYVVIKRDVLGREINCVVSDDVTGARMATAHLLDLGHERIGFVCARPHLSLSRGRLAGYRAALKDYGAPFDENLVRQEENFTMEMGYAAVRSLLQTEDRPGAVFVASDTMALGAYQAVWDLGLRIPDDVALVGYDDIAPAAALQPPLTTVRTSYHEFGRLATQLLLDIIEGRELAPQKRVIQPALVVRKSTDNSDSVTTPAQTTPLADDASGLVGRGGLHDKVVLCARLGGPQQTVLRAFRDLGARVVPGEPGESLHRQLRETGDRHGGLDALVYALELRTDLDSVLEGALSDGRKAAESMSKSGGGAIVFVASGPSSRGAALAAVRAGLGYVIKTLSTGWSTKGIRINGLLSRPEHYRENADLACFLASDKAHFSGEVLNVSP